MFENKRKNLKAKRSLSLGLCVCMLYVWIEKLFDSVANTLALGEDDRIDNCFVANQKL